MAIHMSRVHRRSCAIRFSLWCTKCAPTGECRTLRSRFSTDISAYGNGLRDRLVLG